MHVVPLREPSLQNAVLPARDKSVSLHEQDAGPDGGELGGVGTVPYSSMVTAKDVEPNVHFDDDEHPEQGVELHN